MKRILQITVASIADAEDLVSVLDRQEITAEPVIIRMQMSSIARRNFALKILEQAEQFGDLDFAFNTLTEDKQ